VTSPFDRLPAGVVILADDMRILGANDAIGAMTGSSPAALVGQSIDALLTQPSRIMFQTHVYPALKAEGRVAEVLLQLKGAGDTAMPVLVNASRDPDEAMVYNVVIVRFDARSRWEADLLAATRGLQSERAAIQQRTEELEARHEQSERERQHRDAFMGVLSHELRTPITTIFGMSHLLHQRHASLSSATLAQHLADIEAEADRLHRLTEDMLVIARAEGGRLQIASDPIAVAPLVERSVTAERLSAPDHEFEFERPGQLPLVAGEDLYVEQITRNYLSNATKYSPPGSVVRTVVSAEDGGVAVRVIDNGPGLGDETPEGLFELFYRSQDAKHRASGAGIGLFVCRELAQAMSGRVWAASRAGGAEFGFWLPALVE
jgi:K+-sensing histidine kinase KdpD